MGADSDEKTHKKIPDFVDGHAENYETKNRVYHLPP